MQRSVILLNFYGVCMQGRLEKAGNVMFGFLKVQHLKLLAKLYIRRNRHDLAAQIWQILAIRRNGVGDDSITLGQRQEAYQNAVIEVAAFCTSALC